MKLEFRPLTSKKKDVVYMYFDRWELVEIWRKRDFLTCRLKFGISLIYG